MSVTNNQLIILKQRPEATPDDQHFELVEQAIEPLKDGQILVENHVMSVDPYMRGRMRDTKSYVPPFQVGQPLEGGAVGQVVESKHSQYKTGDFVLHSFGWRNFATIEVGKDPQLMPVDPKLAPIGAYLGVLGMPGLTAYSGILRLGELKADDTVFVSAAAGAVGSVVGQIARIKGATVIGSAGGNEKCQYLQKELGFHHTIDYRSENLFDALKQHAPKGVDIYFDNVGGSHLEAAISAMNLHGRIVICGMIAQYNDPKANTGPKNMIEIIPKRLTIKGLLVMDHYDLLGKFIEDMAGWIQQGELKYQETVFEGIVQAPKAFQGLFTGGNTGKMLVRLKK